MFTIEVLHQPLPGTFHLRLPNFGDERGSFIKTFHVPMFEQVGLSIAPRESFYSVSGLGVLRGMHFQTPPADHQKLVHCLAGRVLDVLVELRPGVHYGKTWSTILDAKQPQLLWIPPGVGHGFLSLSHDSCVQYTVDAEHAPANDGGIRWDSIDYDWPMEEVKVVSTRDQSHPSIDFFKTPFK